MARNPSTHKFTETEMIFRKNLIYLREKNGHTKYSLSKSLNMSQAYYYKMEDLSTPLKPSFKAMEIIANYYNLEVYQLFIKLYEEESKE